MLVSIITVVKNNKNHIARTLESIVQQKYRNLELIVIDGLSEDGTDIIVKKYFKKFKLVRRKDKSVYDSINYACRIANGNYLGLLHSGDVYFDANVINNFVKNSKNFDLISSDIIYFNENYKITRFWESPEVSFNKFPNKFSHTGMFFLKKFIKNINMTKI